MVSTPPLEISIKNKKPVELGDLTKSLSSLADEFKRYVAATEPEASASAVTLYVKEIRTGSIEATLIAASPQIMQGISYVNAVGGFVKYTKLAYDYLMGKSDEKPDLDKTSYENFANIVEPIAKDGAAQLNINAPNGNVYLTLNSLEAKAAQNTARRDIERLGEAGSALHENVVLYWYQARDDKRATTGDKGIIEQISHKPIRVRWANDGIKAQLLHGEENPFKQAYIVDVLVQTIQGRPAVYVVLEVHDKFPRDEV